MGMVKKRFSKSGQVVSAEYVVTILLAVASIAIMSTYVKRSFQAKILDAQMRAVNEASAGLGRVVACEYEPYYVKSASVTDSYSKDSTDLRSGVYSMGDNLNRVMRTNSQQLSPIEVK